MDGNFVILQPGIGTGRAKDIGVVVNHCDLHAGFPACRADEWHRWGRDYAAWYPIVNWVRGVQTLLRGVSGGIGRLYGTFVGAVLSDAGFSVEKGICDLLTAFSARAGQGPLYLVICAEYDSLPGVGHAYGHNIIAAMSVGAGIAAAAVADEVGLTVRVIGTPAEEMGGGGKILLLERGAFAGAHAAMMVHPASATGCCREVRAPGEGRQP